MARAVARGGAPATPGPDLGPHWSAAPPHPAAQSAVVACPVPPGRWVPALQEQSSFPGFLEGRGFSLIGRVRWRETAASSVLSEG